MEELETVSVESTDEDIIEIDEVIDLEIESVEEISIKNFKIMLQKCYYIGLQHLGNYNNNKGILNVK